MASREQRQERERAERGLGAGVVRRLMFWSVWGASAPGVEAASLAGGARRGVARRGVVYPRGVACDAPARRVCWADSYLDAVACARYDGSDRLTLARALPVRLFHTRFIIPFVGTLLMERGTLLTTILR
jgi:hypothetical protein